MLKDINIKIHLTLKEEVGLGALDQTLEYLMEQVSAENESYSVYMETLTRREHPDVLAVVPSSEPVVEETKPIKRKNKKVAAPAETPEAPTEEEPTKAEEALDLPEFPANEHPDKAQLKALLFRIRDVAGSDALKGLYEKYGGGAATLSALAEDKYAEFYEKGRELLWETMKAEPTPS